MVQPKYNPQEALERAKLLMNYDSSKTLTENKQIIEEQNIGLKTAGATTGAALTGAALGAIPAVAGGTSAAAGAAFNVGAALLPKATTVGVAGATALGGAVIAGAAALALTPLIVWYIDKDNAKAKVERMFKYCSTDMSKIKNIPRVVSDAEIRDFSDQLYDAMKGLGTDEEKVYAVFRALQSVSDFCALVVRFNADHGADLLEWLDDDFDQTSEWNQIYRPLRNVVEDNLRDMADEDCVKNPELEKCKKVTDESCEKNPNQEKCKKKREGGGGYTPCTGTYRYGCYAPAIAEVQSCLGLTSDGKYGPNTAATLKSKGFTSFTDADIATICGKTTPNKPTEPADEFDTDLDAEDVNDILNL